MSAFGTKRKADIPHRVSNVRFWGVKRTSLLAQVGVIAMIVWLVLAGDYRRSRTAQPRIVRPTAVRCLDRVLTASPHVRGTQEASSTLGLESYGARNEMPLVCN
jgi:hypothetical protein